MLMSAVEAGVGQAQFHGQGSEANLAMSVRVGTRDEVAGVLFITVPASTVRTAFAGSLPEAGVFALDQINGRVAPTVFSEFGSDAEESERTIWLRVPGTLLRVGLRQNDGAVEAGGVLAFVLFVTGLLLAGVGLLLKFRPYHAPVELVEDPLEIEEEPEEEPGDEPATPQDFSLRSSLKLGSTPPEEASEPGPADGFGVIDLPDLSFSLENPATPRKKVLPPVELVKSIFRAYDIRGVVGETLDAEVARQVGQAMGSLTLEAEAGPVIVARDGRESGVDLVEGMIEGIASTGCDVVDIGAVPTGVLYFAAYELGNGTGVMVTGSHNPPDYNGFKLT